MPRPPDNFLEHPPTRGERPSASRGDSNSMQPADTAYAVPEDGAAVTVGVMIALPVEEGKGLEKWTAEEEEGEVPEVCLGVLECTVKGGD